MIYYQKKAGTELKFEFKDEGIDFTLKDGTIHKSEFIAFEDILNKSHEYFEKNSGHKSRAVYFLVVGVLFLICNIFFKTKLWAWLFLLGAPVFYFLYLKSKVNYKVLNTENGSLDIWVMDNKNQAEIITAIFNQRDTYLINNYLSINYENEPNNEVSKFLWLKGLNLINDKEFELIKDDINNNN